MSISQRRASLLREDVAPISTHFKDAPQRRATSTYDEDVNEAIEKSLQSAREEEIFQEVLRWSLRDADEAADRQKDLRVTLKNRLQTRDADIRRAMEHVSRCWQKQIPYENLCGMHAVHGLLCVLLGWMNPNAVLPKAEFDRSVADRAKMMGVPKEFVKNEAGYTIDFLHYMIEQRLPESFEVKTFVCSDFKPVNCRALIVGTGDHFFAIVKEGDSWFNMDSLFSNEKFSETCGMASNVRYVNKGMDGVLRILSKYPRGMCVGVYERPASPR